MDELARRHSHVLKASVEDAPVPSFEFGSPLVGSNPRRPMKRPGPVVALAAFVSVLVVGVGIAMLASPGEPPVAAPPSTTTGSTLPEGEDPPGTAPVGGELAWVEAEGGLVGLAWRETGDGVEMCWRTTEHEECVPDEIDAPRVAVIPYEDGVLVVTRSAEDARPSVALLVLEIEEFEVRRLTWEVPLNLAFLTETGFEVSVGRSELLEGARVVSAEAPIGGGD